MIYFPLMRLVKLKQYCGKRRNRLYLVILKLVLQNMILKVKILKVQHQVLAYQLYAYIAKGMFTCRWYNLRNIFTVVM